VLLTSEYVRYIDICTHIHFRRMCTEREIERERERGREGGREGGRQGRERGREEAGERDRDRLLCAFTLFW